MLMVYRCPPYGTIRRLLLQFVSICLQAVAGSTPLRYSDMVTQNVDVRLRPVRFFSQVAGSTTLKALLYSTLKTERGQELCRRERLI